MKKKIFNNFNNYKNKYSKYKLKIKEKYKLIIL